MLNKKPSNFLLGLVFLSKKDYFTSSNSTSCVLSPASACG